MILIELTYKASLTDIDKTVDAHRAFLKTHYEAGLFLLSGPKEPRTGGFILALTDDKDTLQKIMLEDPYHKNQLADYTFTQFTPKNYHPLLSGLLSTS